MEVKFISKTPIHIGDGNIYYSSEFLIKDETLYKISLIDFLKLKDKKFLKNLKNYISLNEFASYDDIKDFIKYSIKTKYKYIKYIKKVRSYIKENNIPYIPGSSVKGVIRNTLIWNYITSNKDITDEFLNSLRKDLKNKMIKKKIMFINKIFNLRVGKYNAKYDLLKFLEISDFIPERYNLNITNVKTYSLVKNNLKQKVKINFVESLSGEFVGSINLQFDKLKFALKDRKNYPLLEDKLSIFGVDKELNEDNFIIYLKNSLRKFNEWCLNKEIELCKQAKNSKEFIEKIKEIKILNKKENIIRIGFGTGTIYQTLIKLVEEYDPKLVYDIINKLKLGKFKRKINENKKIYPPYPKSIEFIDNNLPLGWLKW